MQILKSIIDSSCPSVCSHVLSRQPPSRCEPHLKRWFPVTLAASSVSKIAKHLFLVCLNTIFLLLRTQRHDPYLRLPSFLPAYFLEMKMYFSFVSTGSLTDTKHHNLFLQVSGSSNVCFYIFPHKQI